MARIIGYDAPTWIKTEDGRNWFEDKPRQRRRRAPGKPSSAQDCMRVAAFIHVRQAGFSDAKMTFLAKNLMAENRNFAGNPLWCEQHPFGVPKPEYQMGFRSTSAPAKRYLVVDGASAEDAAR